MRTSNGIIGLRGRAVAIALVAACIWVLATSGASAYPDWTVATSPVPVTGCGQCHSTTSDPADQSTWGGSGPHGNYLATTNKCSLCHAVHSAPTASVLLLRGATVTATCQMCHDGTGAIGVYKTIEAVAGPTAVKAEHRVEIESAIPGGSPALTTNLSCNDCHSVHGANTVAAFPRDSGRAFGADVYTVSNSLLRNDVNGKVVAEYGSAWCAACHNERHSDPALGSGVRNHPVALDTDWVYRTVVSTITNVDSWYYFSAPPGPPAGLGRTNSGYIMAPAVAGAGDGRIEEAQANGRAPICQQCHEDARNVNAVFQGDYTHAAIDPMEPWRAAVNPEFLTFPHQTTNLNMTVESWDDLCTNCHPVSTLP